MLLRFLTLIMLLSGIVACGGGGGNTSVSDTGSGLDDVTSFIVSTSVGANGTISIDSVGVNQNDTTSFTVTPDTGYIIDSVTGCNGGLVGQLYTTGSVTADCAVHATFIVPDGRVPATLVQRDEGSSTNPYLIKEKTAYKFFFAETDDQNHHYQLSAAADGDYIFRISEISSEVSMYADIFLSDGSYIPCSYNNVVGNDVYCLIENVKVGDVLLVQVLRDNSIGTVASSEFNLEIKVDDGTVSTAITAKFPNQNGIGTVNNPFLIAENVKYTRTYLATEIEDHHYEFTASTSGTYSIGINGMSTGLIMWFEVDYPDGSFKRCITGNNVPGTPLRCDIENIQVGTSYLIHVLRDHTYIQNAGNFDLEVNTPGWIPAITDPRIGNGSGSVSDPLYIAENIDNPLSYNSVAYSVFKATESGDYTISLSGASPDGLKLSWFFEAVDGSYKSLRTGVAYGVPWQFAEPRSDGVAIRVVDNVKAGTDYRLKVDTTDESTVFSGSYSLKVRSPSGAVSIIPAKVDSIKNDIDGDGLADLLTEITENRVTGPTTRWQIKRSNGSSFSPIGTEKVSLQPSEVIAMADATNNGKNDLLKQWTENGKTYWQVLKNENNAFVDHFTIPPLDSGDYPRAVAFTDIDNNGFADIVIQYQQGGLNNFQFWMNSGESLESSLSSIGFNTSNGHAELIALEDINGDDTADLVIDQIKDGHHCFFAIPFSNGAFDNSGSCFSVPNWVPNFNVHGVADVSGDGKAELIASSGNLVYINWLVLSQPDATHWAKSFDFKKSLNYDTVKTIDVKDLNGDGKADILVESRSLNIVEWEVFPSNGIGFNEAVLWQQSTSPQDKTMGLADYNGDGQLDLLVKFDLQDRSQFYVNLNNGSSFSLGSPWVAWHEDLSFPEIVGIHSSNTTSYTFNDRKLVRWVGGSGRGYTPNEFRERLADDGFVLVDNETPLSAHQCKYNFPSADNEDISADIGGLSCVHEIGGNLKITQQALYGGCDVTANVVRAGAQGVGASCEVGSISQEVAVDLGSGATADYTSIGPSAGACASLTTELVCAEVGATLAEHSMGIEDQYGNGIGVGVSAGVGAGIDGGYDDGVLSGSIDLKLGIGASIDFSLDVDGGTRTLYQAGKDGIVHTAQGVAIVGSAVALAFGDEQGAENWRNSADKVMGVIDTGDRLVYAFLDGDRVTTSDEITKVLNDMGAGIGELDPDNPLSFATTTTVTTASGFDIIEFFDSILKP